MQELKYPNLFKPLKVRNTMFMNRVFLSPIGIPTVKLLSTTYYGGVSLLDRSLGGSGMITINYHGLAAASDSKDPFTKYSRDISRETLSVMKQAGAISNMQLFFHADGYALHDKESLMPSDGLDYRGEPARAMTKEEIKGSIQDLVKRTLEARDFGFDTVMLHFAHDSLTSLFLSPVWNKRDDDYGGSLDNRCRITIEAAKAVREAVGPNYPLTMRISRNLVCKETYSEDDMVYLCKQLEPYIDMVNVSVGMDSYGGSIDKYESNVHMSTMNFEPHMYNIDFCSRLKKETNLIVVPVGAVLDPKEAEQAIADGKCDAVMLGRASIADPFWPEKALEGKDEDIVPCLRCGHCYHISTEHYNVQCSVNPRFRRENRVPLELEKTKSPKNVVVIGGGPAGCNAALTLSKRGHHVILLEQSDCLGGQINVSDYDDYKQDLRRYRNYLRVQVAKAENVEVRFNTKADYEYVKKLNPDAIYVAVGAEQSIPNIKGIEYAKTALDIYPYLNEIKGDIVVIGGGTIGSELALELAERNNNVTLVEASSTFASKGNWLYKLSLYQHMNKAEKLNKMANSQVVEIKENEVLIKNENGEIISVAANKTIIAVGMKPKKELAFSFYGITPKTYMIGDCAKVGKVLDAVNDTYFVAANLK